MDILLSTELNELVIHLKKICTKIEVDENVEAISK